MLILGLGTNLDDRLGYLRKALKLLCQIDSLKVLKTSPIYQSLALLPNNAPATWNKSFLNIAVACTTELTPLAVLKIVKQIEEKMGREKNERWAPRVIDIDILVWDDLIFSHDNLQIPHPGISERPFVLWPLLDLFANWQHPEINIAAILKAWGDRFSGNSPFGTKQIAQRADTSGLVGILNITPDSFSDGGLYGTVDQAVTQAKKLFADGAEVIDIGAESTRPNARYINPVQEWQLLLPVLQALNAEWSKEDFRPKISIDTRNHQVAEQAIKLGVDWINDVTGFENLKMCEAVAGTDVKCVVMHSLSIPPSQDIVLSEKQSAIEQVLQWAELRLNNLIDQGISQEHIILDVGIGFGKLPYQSMALIKNISKLRKLNTSLLVGHSRKSFLNLIRQQPAIERDISTAIVSYELAKQGVDYLRVHNVTINAQALKIACELK